MIRIKPRIKHFIDIRCIERLLSPRGYGMPMFLEPKFRTSMIVTQSLMTSSIAVCTYLDSHSMRLQVTRRDAQMSAFLNTPP